MFDRPVDYTHTIKAFYGAKDPRYNWSIDPDTSLWVPVRDNAGNGMHCGTDFDCPPGTPVRAMVDGFITSARHQSALDYHASAGLRVVQLVQEPGFDSWTVMYTHLESVCVKPGERVHRHEIIARSGAPYLHVDLFNLQRQWKPIPLRG